MQTLDHHAEIERLSALRALNLLGTPPEERFDRVTTLCRRLFGTQAAAITLIEHDRQVAKSLVGADDTDVPREHSFCSVTLEHPDGLVVENALHDPRFAGNPYVYGEPHIRFYAGHPLSAPGGHAVGALCIFSDEPRTLSDSERTLLRDLALWVEKEMAVDEDFDRAKAVQRSLLPTTPPGLEGWQIAGGCIPTHDVGGDLYDWYPTSGRVAITVADVMGKGMGAAIMMATLRAVLRAGTRAGRLLGAVALASQTMEDDFGDNGSFATLFHAEIDSDSGHMSYVDAGHGLALVRRHEGTVERTTNGGLPVGVLRDAEWTVAELELRAGDQACIFSDGLLDLHPDLASAFAAVADAMEHGTDADDVVHRLLEPARGTRPSDDVTVVSVRRME